MSINLGKDIKPISYIKTNAALIDIESYQEMQDAFSLLKIIRLAERDIEKNNVKSADQVMTEIKAKYGLNGRL